VRHFGRPGILALGLVVVLATLALQPSLTAGQARTQQKLVMAFVPSQDSERVLASGVQIARLLKVATGYDIEATVPTSYAATIEALCAGRVDIAWFAPLAYVLANARCGAEVALISVRAGRPYFGSQIIVRADLGARSLSDLAGKRFAFGDPASTSSALWPAVYMTRKGVNPTTFFSNVVYVGGHDRVVTAVYQGSVDAGATFGDRFGSDARNLVERTFPDVKQKVAVLEYVGPPTMPYIPSDTVSLRKELAPEVKQKIVKAMFDIIKTRPGQRAVMDLYSHEGYADYNLLISKYEVDRRQVPSLDAFFNPIREAVRVLGLDLSRLVR